jgi:formiminotetrahydrofolate cyclodeaminase
VETVSEYLTALASEHPTPGGGSAATLVAAMGAALVAMVGRICAKNPKYAAQHDLALALVQGADRLRAELEEARSRDEAAFARVVEASGLPKDAPQRAQRLEQALTQAAAEPLHGARLSLQVVELAAQLLDIPNKNLISDVGCAAEFGAAALSACAYNVRINHRFMKDAATIASQETELSRYEGESSALLAAVRKRSAASSGVISR